MTVDITFVEQIITVIMMRLLIFVVACLSVIPSLAQKKEISQAKASIKSKSNLEKAENDLRKLLKDSTHREDVKIHTALTNVVRTQYEINNEKMYLKQAIDTASFFTTTRKMFLAYEALDSAEAGLLGNGNITTAKSRKKNATLLEKYRQNLYNGGLYFVRNAKYKDAFNSFDTYIDCMRQPLFSAHVASFDTTTMSTAAFWTLFCGYKINNPQMALKYADLALKNEKFRSRSFQYLVEVYEQQKDLSHYLDALKQGFMENKTSRFFFTKLVDYYNDKNLLDSALQVVDYSLQEEPDNSLFLFAKSNILLNKGDYDGCISITDKLIARLDTVPELYYNAGISYLNKALLPETSNVVMDAKEIDQCLKMSMLYMEKYRAMRPEDRERWVTPLYNIYFKLNMGKQFEEMSNLLQKMRK